MWLYMIGGVLVLLGIIGTFTGAGAVTIVLIPVGIVIVASVFFYGMAQRSGERSGGGDTDAHPSTGGPLPHSTPSGAAHVTTSPEALADARRAEQ